MYLPESTAVKKGKMLGTIEIKKIIFKLILFVITLVFSSLILEKNKININAEKPIKNIKIYLIIWLVFQSSSL